jgi:hypothetical protein
VLPKAYDWSTSYPLVVGGFGKVPKTPGVYLVTVEKTFGRFIGRSSTVYIGCSEKGTQGLWLELSNLLNPSRNHIYTLKPLRDAGVKLWYQYAETPPGDAAFIEYHLLAEYENLHFELPPRNRSRPRHTSCGYCQDDGVIRNLYERS